MEQVAAAGLEEPAEAARVASPRPCSQLQAFVRHNTLEWLGQEDTSRQRCSCKSQVTISDARGPRAAFQMRVYDALREHCCAALISPIIDNVQIQLNPLETMTTIAYEITQGPCEVCLKGWLSV